MHRFIASTTVLGLVASCSLVIDLDPSNPTREREGSGGSGGAGGADGGSGGSAGASGPTTITSAGGTSSTGGAAGSGGLSSAGGAPDTGGTSAMGGDTSTDDGSGGTTTSDTTGSAGAAGAPPMSECGNGDLEDPEECDLGEENSETGECTPNCTWNECGDGFVWQGEEDCDTAGESAACDADCSPVVCGDSEINEAAGEVCDSGVNNGTRNACESNCRFVCQGACPLRVDVAAAAGGDGRSWQTALNDLQAAVVTQFNALGGQVWVKTGTFQRPGSNMAVLNMNRGVPVYGGFAGTEGALTDRDTAGRTTLDGQGTRGPVVAGASNTLLDGFLVTGGNADFDMSIPQIFGGGMLNRGLTNLVVRNTEFQGNLAWGCGGGMYNADSEVQLFDVVFQENAAEQGGGMCAVEDSVVEMTDVKFIANRGEAFPANTAATVEGGGLYIENSDVTMRGGLVRNHPAYVDFGTNTIGQGTALYNVGGQSLFFDVRFDSNASAFGTVVYNESGSPEFVNCSFSRHSFSGNGVGAVTDTDAALFVNSTFADNSGPDNANLVGTNATEVENSVLYVESNTDTNVSGGVSVSNSCMFFSVGMGGQPRPFPATLEQDADGVPRFLLVQSDTNPCIDAGDATLATNAGLDWQALTTSPNGCLDSTLVDAGRHYASTLESPVACP